MNTVSRIFLISVLVAFSSCNRKFDKSKWEEYYHPGNPNPNRSKMLKDLTSNYDSLSQYKAFSTY